jgi:hypothetical protein
VTAFLGELEVNGSNDNISDMQKAIHIDFGAYLYESASEVANQSS